MVLIQTIDNNKLKEEYKEGNSVVLNSYTINSEVYIFDNALFNANYEGGNYYPKRRQFVFDDYLNKAKKIVKEKLNVDLAKHEKSYFYKSLLKKVIVLKSSVTESRIKWVYQNIKIEKLFTNIKNLIT